MLISVDTETISLEDKTLLGISVAFKLPNGKIYAKYYPIKHNGVKVYSIKELKKLFASFFSISPTFIFHNSSFDIPVLYCNGINLLPYQIHDTQVISHLLDERQPHGLKKLVKKYIGYQMKDYKEIVGTGRKKKQFWQTGMEGIKYAKEDALYTYLLFEKLYPKLRAQTTLWDLYYQIERPLLYTVAKMHIYGIPLDVDKINEIERYCLSNLELLQKKLNIYMKDININSSQQLAQFFIDKRKLPVIKKTPKGAPAMDKEVLEEYAKKDIVAKMLLDYRKFYKITSTFIPAFKKHKHGWIHPSFNQVATRSGRFSSSNPNWQNIPTDDEFGLRECVIASEGHTLIGADFSQIELRVAAHVSQDRNLMQAYIDGKDIHDKTAKSVGVDRRTAKTLNFGILYGIGAGTLAKKLNVSIEEAQAYKQRFFDTYPKLLQWIEETKKEILQKGYTETIFGRKRRVSYYFNSMDEYEQQHELRALVNHVIQGSAADIMKIAMVKVDKTISPMGAAIIATIHDELIIDCPDGIVDEVLELTKKNMEDFNLRVPLVVDIRKGRSWKDVH